MIGCNYSAQARDTTKAPPSVCSSVGGITASHFIGGAPPKLGFVSKNISKEPLRAFGQAAPVVGDTTRYVRPTSCSEKVHTDGDEPSSRDPNVASSHDIPSLPNCSITVGTR